MKKLKINSTAAFATLILFSLLVSTSVLAQTAKEVNMEGTDQLRFTVETITAAPGEKITVKLSNNTEFPAAAMSHNFVLLKLSADPDAFNKASAQHADNGYIAPELENQIIAHTGMAGGGETVEVTFKAPKKPGEYIYVCTFPGHFAAGMKGTLTVK